MFTTSHTIKNIAQNQITKSKYATNLFRAVRKAHGLNVIGTYNKLDMLTKTKKNCGLSDCVFCIYAHIMSCFERHSLCGPRLF